MTPDHKLAADYVEDTVTGSFDLALDSFARLTPVAAAIASSMLKDVPGFNERATERGSLAARTRIVLGALETGKRLSESQVRSLADGFGPGEETEPPVDQTVGQISAPPSRSSALVEHMAQSYGRTSEAEASSRLATLSKNPDWASRALERGTAEAAERLQLNAAVTGHTMTAETAATLASGALGG